MPKKLYVKEITEHVQKTPFSQKGEGMPGTRLRIGGNEVKLIGISHTKLTKLPFPFKKAAKKEVDNADVLLMERHFARTVPLKKHIGILEFYMDTESANPSHFKDKHLLEKIRDGYGQYTLEPNNKKIIEKLPKGIFLKFLLKNILEAPIHLVSGITWTSLLSNIHPGFTPSLASKFKKTLPKISKELEEGKDSDFVYALMVARSADMAKTIKNISTKRGLKKKKIVAFMGLAHEPIVDYFLKNPTAMRKVLKEWAE